MLPPAVAAIADVYRDGIRAIGQRKLPIPIRLHKNVRFQQIVDVGRIAIGGRVGGRPSVRQAIAAVAEYEATVDVVAGHRRRTARLEVDVDVRSDARRQQAGIRPVGMIQAIAVAVVGDDELELVHAGHIHVDTQRLPRGVVAGSNAAIKQQVAVAVNLKHSRAAIASFVIDAHIGDEPLKDPPKW